MNDTETFLLEGHGSRAGAFLIFTSMVALFVTTVHQWRVFFSGNPLIDIVKLLVFATAVFAGFWGIAHSLKTKVVITNKYFRICSASTSLRSQKIPIENIDYIDLREILTRVALSPAHLKIHLKNEDKSYTIAGISNCRTFFPAFFNAVDIINQSGEVNLRIKDNAIFSHKKPLVKV